LFIRPAQTCDPGVMNSHPLHLPAAPVTMGKVQIETKCLISPQISIQVSAQQTEGVFTNHHVQSISSP